MKNLWFLLSTAVLIVACEPGDPLTEKKATLSTLKESLADINEQIKTLEKEIQQLDTTTMEAAPIVVDLTTLRYQPFEHYVGVEGIVEAEKDVMVSFQAQGEITRILVEEGDRVKKGQVLARMNAAPLQNQLSELKTRYELANTLFLKQKKLWIDKNIGSEIQYLEAKSNKEALDRSMAALRSQIALTVVKTPIDGIVDQINYKQGAVASPQMPFAQIVNLSNLYINAELSEAYLPKVKTGDSVKVSFHALGIAKELPIYRIGNVINPQNRSFEIQLKMKNNDGSIKPNALASMKVRDFYQEKAIVLPSNVVQQDIDGSYVYVAKQVNNQQWKANKVYVETAMTNDDNETLIVGGLSPGDKVVVDGYTDLTNDAPITQIMNANTSLQ